MYEDHLPQNWTLSLPFITQRRPKRTNLTAFRWMHFSAVCLGDEFSPVSEFSFTIEQLTTHTPQLSWDSVPKTKYLYRNFHCLLRVDTHYYYAYRASVPFSTWPKQNINHTLFSSPFIFITSIPDQDCFRSKQRRRLFWGGELETAWGKGNNQNKNKRQTTKEFAKK